MKRALALLLLPALALAGDTPPAQPAETAPPAPLTSQQAADTLREDELQQIIDLLRENYIRPAQVTDDALARSRVQGLLDRLGAGARVFSKLPAAPATPAPFRSERLPDGTALLRAGSLENLGDLDAALASLAAKPPPSLILDLRATPHSADFELAAEVCRRFVPKGRILFTVKRPRASDEEIHTSRDQPRWRGHLVILVDTDTAGAAEVIAAVLRTHLRAYVIGQRTRGEAAQFEDIALPGGKILRLAIGEVTLPDNSPVFPGGLMPDLPVPIPQEQTDALLAAALTGGATPLITEAERPRMNEAALIAGTNPEYDALQAGQGKPAATPPLRDEVLLRALDYLTSVRVFEAGAAKRK